MSKAVNYFKLFEKRPSELEKKLILIFKNKRLKIRKIKLLKKKLIIKNQYKISVLLSLKDNLPQKIALEIHDNDDYFKKNIFALTKLKSKIKPAFFFGKIPAMKIIAREYLEGDFFSDLILKKKVSKKFLFLSIKEISNYLSFLHNLKIKAKPRFLTNRLNEKIEKIILIRTLEFIKPDIEHLRIQIKRNLESLLKKIDLLGEKNRICLIHGDYQVANFILKRKKEIALMDFDTLEMGNPTRDLGRFIFQLSYLMKTSGYNSEEIKKAENLFLKNYLHKKKMKLYPDLKTNINLHKAEMIQYMILGKIWEEKIPSLKEIKGIEKLLNIQSKLLNL